MGIAKALFNGILDQVFAEGNKIELYATVPDENTEMGGSKISGASYKPYTIGASDFIVSGGSATSNDDMMFYLCNENSHGSAEGFGVFDKSNKLLYFGKFKDPMPITYNTVPTIKKFNASKGEGVRVTMTSTEANATSE